MFGNMLLSKVQLVETIYVFWMYSKKYMHLYSSHDRKTKKFATSTILVKSDWIIQVLLNCSRFDFGKVRTQLSVLYDIVHIIYRKCSAFRL